MQNRKRNVTFIVSCFVSVLFLLTPIFLRFPCVRNSISLFLKPLGNSDYRIAYIETFGAILGTVTAISGTLWTQNRIDIETKQKEIQQTSAFIYYELDYALNNIKLLWTLYCLESNYRDDKSQVSDLATFSASSKYFQIYISEEWKNHIAHLSKALSNTEIDTLYKIYHTICDINLVLNPFLDEIPEELLRKAHGRIKTLMGITQNMNSAPDFSVYIKPDIQALLDRIKQIANINNDKENIE